MEENTAKIEFVKALIAVQSEMKEAKKTASNPFFRSRYSPLDEVWDTCKEPLAKHGFAISQTLDSYNGKDVLATELMHKGGFSKLSFYPLYPAKPNDPQAFQSSVTYARRGGLSAIIGLTVGESDDDGNIASDKKVTMKETIKNYKETKAPIKGEPEKEKLLTVKDIKALKSQKNGADVYHILLSDDKDYITQEAEIAEEARLALNKGLSVEVQSKLTTGGNLILNFSSLAPADSF